MRKCMNFKSVILCAVMLLAGSAVYGQDNIVDEVVWVVGNEAILKSEVEEARMSAIYEGRKFDRDPYCVIPEEIAVQKLFLHQAELDSIEVSESEVIQRVDYMTNMYIANIGSREKMEEYFNKTSSQIRETLRENAREGLRVQKMQQAGGRRQGDSSRGAPLFQGLADGQHPLHSDAGGGADYYPGT